MKNHVKDFCLRGLLAAGFGPMVLAIVYGILGLTGVTSSLSPGEVCRGILSVTLMAFIAAGITVVYTVEKLPLLSAILLHAGVLYLDYLLMYLLNSWIPRDLTAIGIFSAIFAAGFAAVWVGIYFFSKNRTDRINKKLQAQ